MSIFIKFFRDFLDGWVYVIYVIICLLLIFLCIRPLLQKRKKVISTSSESVNIPNTSTDYTDSIIQTSNDPVFRYSGDIIDDKK